MAEMIIDPENTSHDELLAQGMRAYYLREYSHAVQALSQATEILVKQFGSDMHDSLGDIYLYYGKALLELSRTENEPLGDAIPKSVDDEDTEIADGELELENNILEEGGESMVERDKKDEKVGEISNPGPLHTQDKSEEHNDDCENDEPSDLQVAWEVLELAKKIFTDRGKDGEKNLAETLIALGEISLENEKYDDAVSDMVQGLEIQKKLFFEDSRTLAETYYKLGVVHGTNTQLNSAMDCFEEALKCLKHRLVKLENIESKSVDDELEISDIKDLMPTIEEKVSDVKNYQEQFKNGVSNLLNGSEHIEASCSSSDVNGANQVSTNGGQKPAESLAKPVSDISHLVKRKRPVETKDKGDAEYKPVEKQIC